MCPVTEYRASGDPCERSSHGQRSELTRDDQSGSSISIRPLTPWHPSPAPPRLSLRWDPIGLVTTSIVSLTSCNGQKMLGENPVYIQSKIFLMLFILTYFNLSHLFLHENSNQPDDIWWDVLFSNVTLNHCVEIIYFCRIAIRTEYPTKWVSILLFSSK